MTANFTHYKMVAQKAAQQNDLDEAERMWQAALKEAESYGKDDGRYALAVDSLAGLYFSKGKYDEALPLFHEALAIRERNLARDHEDLGTCFNNLAALHFKMEQYGEAEDFYKKALQIRERKFGKESKKAVEVVYQLGLLFHAQKRYEQAENYYKPALDIKNKLYGAGHQELCSLLRNYADLLRKTNREPTAVQMEQFARSIEEKNG